MKLMNKRSLLFGCALSMASSDVQAPTPADSLVHAGIQFHDHGQYQEAIDLYKKTLEIMAFRQSG